MKIIADSATLFSPQEGAELGITVIPVCVSINNETYKDYEEISSETFLQLIKNGGVPTSSQPAIGDILDVLEECPDDTLFLTVGDGLSGAVSFSHPAAALAGIPLTGKAELPGFCRHKCRKGRFFCPGIECPAGADLFGKIKRFMNRNGHCGGIGRRAADCRPYGVRGIVGSAEVESGWRMADGHPYIVHCPFSIVHSQAPTGAVEL